MSGADSNATEAIEAAAAAVTRPQSTFVEYVVQLDGTSANYFATELQGRTRWLQASLTQLQSVVRQSKPL